MKTTQNITSTASFFWRRCYGLFRVQTRMIHVIETYSAQDERFTIGSIILKTRCDFGATQNEVDSKISLEQRLKNYRNRSWEELSSMLFKAFFDETFLLLRINQCVIDPKKYKEYRETKKLPEGLTINTGHVISGLFSYDNRTRALCHVKNSLISKLKKGFECDSSILDSKLFYDKDRSEYAATTYSSEYFWAISLNKLKLTSGDYLNSCSHIKKNSIEYDIMHYACGHAVYQAITRKFPQKSNGLSPQTAAQLAIMDSLRINESHFNTNLKNIAIQSELVVRADELGLRYLSDSARNESDSPFSANFT